MTRMSTLLLIVILLPGCWSSYQDGPLVNLDDRLARIEETRLARPDETRLAGAQRDTTPAPHPGDELAAAGPRVNRPLILADRPDDLNRAGWRTELSTWTLDDMGDPADDPSSLKPQASGLDLDRAEKYARRPPLKSFGETVKRDIKDMPADLWRDTRRVYANPVNLVILGSGLAGSLTLRETGPDRTVEHHFNRNGDLEPPHHVFDEDWRDAFGAMGNPAVHFALAGAWYLLGQQTMDDKTYEVGKTLFSALLINGVTVAVGQAATYDRSPNGERGTLPSGHTSSSFVVASVLHEAYGHVVGVPLYGLATLVAVERLDDREHYLSDVVMGAVLGTVVGHSVASGRDPEFFGWKILPYADPHAGSGVAFVKTLE